MNCSNRFKHLSFAALALGCLAWSVAIASDDDEDSVTEVQISDEPAAEPAPAQLPEQNVPRQKPREFPPQKESQKEPEADEPGSVDVTSPGEPAAPKERTKAPIDAASFKGIQPGHSTRDDVDQGWGPPKEIKKVKGAVQLSYQIDPFERVLLTLTDNVVTSMVLYFQKPVPPGMLAKQLGIDDVRAVEVMDARGTVLGQAFPERGVLFSFAADSDGPHVLQIMLEPIDSQPFVLRAELNQHSEYTLSLEDVDYALKLDAKNARAHWLRARLLGSIGRLEEALKAAEQATAIEPTNAAFRLTVAKLLAETADVSGAIRMTTDVLENAKLSKLLQAQAYCQLGDFVAASATRDHQQALAHHMQAIKLAEPLSVDPRMSVRRAAKEILVDANLAVAHDIAWGRWQQKARVVPKWLDRAGSFATDLVQKEHATSEIRLRVNLRTLSAWAGVPEAPDPSTTIESTIEIGKSLVEASEDEARKARLAWQVGLAMVDAMEIQHARRQEGAAIEAGTLASELLKQGEAAGAQVAGHDYLVGRLYYRLGNIHAVNREDHKQAIAWYDKAISLLESPVPATLADNGTQGETFISMAVSYWEIGGREEAVRLTREGVGLVEKAVEEGLLAKTALIIPYGNLSSMHEELGDKTAAHKYSELAARCEQTDKR